MVQLCYRIYVTLQLYYKIVFSLAHIKMKFQEIKFLTFNNKYLFCSR